MKRETSKFWYANERKVMDKLGLKGTPRSGAGEVLKEDGYNDYVICQLKSTAKGQISIKRLDVEKLIYHANVDKKIPIFAIQFLNGPMLLATIPAELGNIAEYLNKGLFEKADAIEVREHKQGEVKKIKGKSKTVESIIKDAKLIEVSKVHDKTLLEIFKERKLRSEKRNGRRSYKN